MAVTFSSQAKARQRSERRVDSAQKFNIQCSKRKAYLVCFGTEVFENWAKNHYNHVSFYNWLGSKFRIWTLFLSKRKFNYLIFCDSVTRTSGEGVSSRIKDWPASLRQGLDQVVNHLRWYGHPLLLLKSLEQLTHICRGVHSAPYTSVVSLTGYCH